MKKIIKMLPCHMIMTSALLAILCMGVIKMTPVMIESLQVAQKMQRCGKVSVLQNFSVLFWLTCLVIEVCISCKCMNSIAFKISLSIKRKRRAYQKSFEIDRDKKVLRKILFEEIRGDVPIEDEDGLWETLGELTTKELEEAREERKQLLYEMEEKAVGG